MDSAFAPFASLELQELSTGDDRFGLEMTGRMNRWSEGKFPSKEQQSSAAVLLRR
jgi:hypothetical protein